VADVQAADRPRDAEKQRATARKHDQLRVLVRGGCLVFLQVDEEGEIPLPR